MSLSELFSELGKLIKYSELGREERYIRDRLSDLRGEKADIEKELKTLKYSEQDEKRVKAIEEEIDRRLEKMEW